MGVSLSASPQEDSSSGLLEKLIRSVLCAAWVGVPQSDKDNRGRKQTIAGGYSAPVSSSSLAITSACCPPTPNTNTHTTPEHIVKQHQLTIVLSALQKDKDLCNI